MQVVLKNKCEVNVFLNPIFTHPMADIKRRFKTPAIIGFVSKGIIYLVMGTLSLLAALKMGGESSGTNQVLKFLKEQPFGQILLMLLGVGLLCYSYWMFVQCFKDPENRGSTPKAKWMRFGLFTTGVVYTVVAFLSFYHIFSSSSEDTSAGRYLPFLGSTTVSAIFIGIGIILAIQAIVLIIGVFKGGLLDQFNLEGQRYSKQMRMIGKFGFYSRAFIVAIIAYFFLRAGIYTGNHDIKGIEDAFSFLGQSFLGSILMAFTAIGFMAYGVFYIFLPRFKSFGEQ
ncbi:DUF1206 domain-containing protein [Aequorivita sp. SDUM287046]|uniref:DUF1206 domain-containing protein n=1 Tax=Aequorivita aurantiaca TaxID=3053356 RepID=A0ABT8DQJ4_9FLAO|nr:DUF1206 domain-containing protein [Aequorivita aurantiaca]MDN3725495.1 DUF1206 domain-containing protein [Aequorivita aurantiaca]